MKRLQEVLMHRHELVIPAGAGSRRLLQALRDAYPGAPASLLRKSLQQRDIRINGVRIPADQTVVPGDVIHWYTSWTPLDIEIVYEDEHLMVINKPAGLSSDARTPGAASALGMVQARAAGAYEPRMVHRLDQMTSGLLVFGKDDHTANALLAAFKERRISKYYECIVGGEPKQHEMLRAYLIKDALHAEVRVTDRSVHGAKEICTEYRLLGKHEHGYRLSVTLHTGRTHQIRAHLAYVGLPILGDDKYGDRMLNRTAKAKRMMLAAVEIRFDERGPLGYLSQVPLRIRAPF